MARKIASQAPAAEKKRKKQKGGKQLLSFGDEEGDSGDLPVRKKAKFDARIVMAVEEEPAEKVKTTKKSGTQIRKVLSEGGRASSGDGEHDPPESRSTTARSTAIATQECTAQGFRERPVES